MNIMQWLHGEWTKAGIRNMPATKVTPGQFHEIRKNNNPVGIGRYPNGVGLFDYELARDGQFRYIVAPKKILDGLDEQR